MSGGEDSFQRSGGNRRRSLLSWNPNFVERRTSGILPWYRRSPATTFCGRVSYCWLHSTLPTTISSP